MLLTIVAAGLNAPGFESMAAFALKTVFAVAAFFSAVANGAGHPQCEERQAGISSSSAVLQLFTHDNCITEGLYDHQMIIQQAFKLKDTCICHAVDMGVRQKISSMLFERGFGQPESVFYLLQGADCASDELGYGKQALPRTWIRGFRDSPTAYAKGAEGRHDYVREDMQQSRDLEEKTTRA
ncbi:hypothetical protein BJ138DRAFT_1130871 [Hygrophoropsis aurantiaca]|uniref:Uncharacterized protein n=1 Tax=Hygrophoropsis aurantiaca TaxID=72124 RepID=A0ACB7ZU19_9AGAM|nr:hypothetical protein BJ138DRAFT_1130871 [Hygrophoropsis aurantiaca]